MKKTSLKYSSRAFGIALLSLFLLSACGFTLRGTGGNYTLPFKTIYMTVSSNEYFGAKLKRQIESAGAKVVPESKEAEVSLIILTRDKERETLSLSTSGRVREYALFYTFRFQVTDAHNHILLEPQKIHLRRTLTYTESQAYAKDKEEDMLYESMEDDVIQQVVQRLVDLKIQPSSTEKEPDL